MKRYTAAELDLMARLVASEMADRFADRVLFDEHEACKEYAAETGKPVQGVCPTMFHYPNGVPEDGIDCPDLAHRLKQHAKEVEQATKGGPFR